jgi:4-hydroxy-tetrahydrodipicolinate synthase
MELARPFRGIIPPIVTPLLSADALDVSGLERLVEHQISGGVHAIFALGTTGEGPALSYRLRHEMIERTVQFAAGRIPVLVNVTDAAYSETQRMTEFAAHAGASAVVLAPPFYFPMSQADLLRLVEDFARRAALPVFIYNIPVMTKTAFAPESVALAAEMPNIHGFKDSSGDLDYVKQVLAAVRHHEDFSVLLGPEHQLVEGMKLGVAGGVHGGANLFPDLFVALFNACTARNEEEIERLNAKVAAMGASIYDSTDGEYRYIRGLKYALFAMGLCSDLPAWPYLPADAQLRKAIDIHLQTKHPQPIAAVQP